MMSSRGYKEALCTITKQESQMFFYSTRRHEVFQTVSSKSKSNFEAIFIWLLTWDKKSALPPALHASFLGHTSLVQG